MAGADADANPIVEALFDELAGRLGEADAVQRVQRNVDLVRAEIEEYAALRAEAAAELAQAGRRLAEVASSAAAHRAIQEPPPQGLVLMLVEDDPEPEVIAAAPRAIQEPPPEGLVLMLVEDDPGVAAALAAAPRALQVPPEAEGLVLVQLDGDPELAAHAAAYVEAAGRVELIERNQLLLVEALVLLLVSRALAFALSRVRLLPRVLGTVAAAYALAYAVSWGAVVPGPTSILWIAVLVVCFLFGVPVVGNLP